MAQSTSLEGRIGPNSVRLSDRDTEALKPRTEPQPLASSHPAASRAPSQKDRLIADRKYHGTAGMLGRSLDISRALKRHP